MSDQHCKTCAHRDENGYCRSQKLAERLNQRNEDTESADMLLYDYYEGGGFWVGPEFGCVHYATRTCHATSAAIDDHLKKARSVAEDMRKKIADKVEVLRNE